MIEDTPLPFDLPAASRKKVTADFAGGLISSDGGLVLLREADRRLGLSETLAGCIREWRDPERVVHALQAMLRFRMFAIACGYEDVVDSHTDVVQPAEEGVIGFSIESCLAGALGDRICKCCEVRQAGGWGFPWRPRRRQTRPARHRGARSEEVLEIGCSRPSWHGWKQTVHGFPGMTMVMSVGLCK